MRQSIRQRFGPFAPWEYGYSTRTDTVPDGQSVGPPDFVGIGVQKAGTTWWFELIAAHRGVHQPAGLHKERHYFARFASGSFSAAEVDAYHRSFPRPPGTITGEWTPDYLEQPWAAPLLRAAAPQARLLLMVRDPVERFLSGVAHSGLTPGSNLGTVLAEAVRRGQYASSLAPWLAAFPETHLLVVQYEKAVADPQAELARTMQFLGVDGAPPEIRPEQRVSPTLTDKIALTEDARRRLVDVFADDVERLVARFPHVDLALWPNFRNH